MIRCRWLMIPLTLLLCAQTRPAATTATRPATAPATAPTTGPATTQAADSEIRQVVLKIMVTMREGDRARLLALCYAENAAQKKNLEAVMDLGIEAHKTNKIAIARWGRAGDNVVEQYASEKEYLRLTQSMSKATVSVEGATARLEPAAPDSDNDDVETIFLRRVAGQWLMDFSKMVEEPVDTLDGPDNSPFMQQMTFIRNTIVQLGKDIEAGKYKRAQDAKAAFDKAVDDKMKDKS